MMRRGRWAWLPLVVAVGALLSGCRQAPPLPADKAFSPMGEYRVEPDTLFRPATDYTLWYTAPATAQRVKNPWMDYALPLGNGQLGAMAYGGVRQEVVQFNEKTLWEGSPDFRGAYQNFGWLTMADEDTLFSVTDSLRAVRRYVRWLDMGRAVLTARWQSPDGRTTFTRECLASHPDGCIAIRLTASGPARLHQRVGLVSAHADTTAYAAATATFGGRLSTVAYRATMTVRADGGRVEADMGGIRVSGARELLVVLSAGTDYDPLSPTYTLRHPDLAARHRLTAQRAAAKGWAGLLRAHLADYVPLFNRADFRLAHRVNAVPTDSLIRRYGKAGAARDRMLEGLAFQYGRYLLMASSRGVALPANLQGIWNNTNTPPWASDIHANINVEMNYWAAEAVALPETHAPLLDYVRHMATAQPQWRAQAKGFGARGGGWATRTANNIFGYAYDADGSYPEAGAWLCHHLWSHYRYTLDRRFLAECALPTMVGAVRFWQQRLVANPGGTLECPDTWSPEHGPRERAAAHAQQLVWALFRNTLAAIDTLGLRAAGVDEAFVRRLRLDLARLDPGLHTEVYRGMLGKVADGVAAGDTILREWRYTRFAEGNGDEPRHRHLSHLMALYPLCTVRPDSRWAAPMARSLLLRGAKAQGWSLAWKTALWARLRQGERCMDNFRYAFRHTRIYRASSLGGCYYNLLSAHAPFQIDGDLGLCAAMAEMLVQGHDGEVALLPALPRAWAEGGSARGLRVEEGFEIGMDWAAGRLLRATVRSRAARPCTLRHPGIGRRRVTDLATGAPPARVRRTPDRLSFATLPGHQYVVE